MFTFRSGFVFVTELYIYSYNLFKSLMFYFSIVTRDFINLIDGTIKDIYRVKLE